MPDYSMLRQLMGSDFAQAGGPMRTGTGAWTGQPANDFPMNPAWNGQVGQPGDPANGNWDGRSMTYLHGGANLGDPGYDTGISEGSGRLVNKPGEGLPEAPPFDPWKYWGSGPGRGGVSGNPSPGVPPVGGMWKPAMPGQAVQVKGPNGPVTVPPDVVAQLRSLGLGHLLGV